MCVQILDIVEKVNATYLMATVTSTACFLLKSFFAVFHSIEFSLSSSWFLLQSNEHIHRARPEKRHESARDR